MFTYVRMQWNQALYKFYLGLAIEAMKMQLDSLKFTDDLYFGLGKISDHFLDKMGIAYDNFCELQDRYHSKIRMMAN